MIRSSMPDGGNLYLQTDNVVLDKNFADPYDVAPGKYVKISVTDTGTGMDEATQQKIFEPFYTSKPSGSGLGLSIVKSIIETHDGIIEIESKKKKGTRVTITLPLQKEQETEKSDDKSADS